MVDRVGNGPGYGYPQINEKKINTGAAGTGEKFQFDYNKEGAIYEPSSETAKKQAEKAAPLKNSESKNAEVDGVKLTLSGMKEGKKVQESTVSTGGFLDTITDVFGKIFEKVKAVFNSIWNDQPIGQEKAEDVHREQPAKIEKPKNQFEKAKAEAEAFLASNEGKKVARNSDLLTYYDKHGVVVSVSPSDKQRILYGDKNHFEV